LTPHELLARERPDHAVAEDLELDDFVDAITVGIQLHALELRHVEERVERLEPRVDRKDIIDPPAEHHPNDRERRGPHPEEITDDRILVERGTRLQNVLHRAHVGGEHHFVDLDLRRTAEAHVDESVAAVDHLEREQVGLSGSARPISAAVEAASVERTSEGPKPAVVADAPSEMRADSSKRAEDAGLAANVQRQMRGRSEVRHVHGEHRHGPLKVRSQLFELLGRGFVRRSFPQELAEADEGNVARVHRPDRHEPIFEDANPFAFGIGPLDLEPARIRRGSRRSSVAVPSDRFFGAPRIFAIAERDRGAEMPERRRWRHFGGVAGAIRYLVATRGRS
jgi:hypothetical protein